MGTRRKSNQTRDELRDLVLAAGREIVLEEGLVTGSSNLTFKRVFAQVEAKTGIRITNASVIRRVWDHQADFQADVLVEIANDETRPEVDDTLGALGRLFADADLSTLESRARLVQQVCRAGGEASNTAIAQSTNFALWISVVAMATSTAHPEERQRIQRALQGGYGTTNTFWRDTYSGLAAMLGLRLRAPWTITQFAICVTALTDKPSSSPRFDGVQLLPPSSRIPP